MTDKRLKKITKVCKTCKKEYSPFTTLSKFCSRKCQADAYKIKDGMTKDERYRRKKGVLKMGTPEWLEKIRATTSAAMARPEIKEKISKPRGPQSVASRAAKSNALAGRLPKNMWFGSSRYPNVQRGDYENSKGIMYFRSKWEANYALFLDYLIAKGEISGWEYETDVFIFDEIKFGTRSYLPDFKVINNDGSHEYHEVKGFMDSKSKTKLRRMKKYYPEERLVLVDKTFYTDLVKKFGRVLNFY